jgi:hypothetical protein
MSAVATVVVLIKALVQLEDARWQFCSSLFSLLSPLIHQKPFTEFV